MTPELKFKAFGNHKSINEITYQMNCWLQEFSFIKTEIKFLIKLLKHYPFQSNIPNLYERLQQYLNHLSSYYNNRNAIVIDLNNYKNDLMGEDENHHLESYNYYAATYQKLAEAIFNYLKEYKNLKSSIFEYVDAVMVIKNDEEIKSL
jgi:glycyl-tRNA synthetase beta subunit